MCVAPVAKMTWSKASKYCQSLGARIVIVDTHQKATAMNEYIQAQFPSTNYVWIGGVSYSSQSSSTHRFHKTWVWTDCRAISGTYEPWAPGEPSGTVDKCAVIQLWDFRWNDGPCSFSLNSVCEKVTSRPLYEIIDNTDDTCPSSDQTTTTISSTTTTTTTTTSKTIIPPTTTPTTTSTITTPTTTSSITTPATTTSTTTTTTTTNPTTAALATTTPTTTSTTTTTTTTNPTTAALATTTPTTTSTTTTTTTTNPKTAALATTTPTTTSTTTAPTIPTSSTTRATTSDSTSATAATTSTTTQISTTQITSSTPTTNSTTKSGTKSIPTHSTTVETISASTSGLTKTTHRSTSVTTPKQKTSTSSYPNPPRTIQTSCTCFCKSKDRLEVITETTVNEKQEQIKRQLVVDKTKLSQTIARYTSVSDRRPSTSGIGVTWLAIILIPFGLLLISDIAVVCQLFMNKHKTG
ncbi:uncharacterized protein [Haliotis asinina]|uniref:uncharacterized protein n=1 Tax=Haliotis asinina TaxID=109174 RepID=UPI003531A99E